VNAQQRPGHAAWPRAARRPAQIALPVHEPPMTLGHMPTLYRAADQPASARRDYWRHVLGEQLVPMEIRTDDESRLGDQLLVGEVGPLRVVDATNGAGEVVRTERQIRRFDPGLYQMFLQLEGTADGEQEGRAVRFAPGDLSIVDLSRPLRCRHSTGRTVMVTFPKSLLPLRPQKVSTLLGMRISGDRGTAALVAGLLRQLPENLDVINGSAARLGSAILDLLHATLAEQLELGRTVAEHTRQRALLMRIHAYIDQHLGEARLTPARIAAAQHISVRYLYKLFEGQALGVAELIRQRRLERCRVDLQDPALVDLPVAAIAHQWGFTDDAHFNRVFRRAYGVAPGRFRLGSS
jgi:AraC-like DNA-binding protein